MPNLTAGDFVEAGYNRVEDLAKLFIDSPAFENELMTAVKVYANAYARFQLARVEAELQRASYWTAARAVIEQAAKLEGLDK